MDEKKMRRTRRMQNLAAVIICWIVDLLLELDEFDDENLAHAHEEVHPVNDDDDDSDDDEVMMSSMVKDRQHKKSKGCGDSAMELMSEMEKNRLFWETCLAS
ncbi:hypothetical protein Acr_13g0001530 [Actinidia rufa]|uniref:Uncharacterized protein n=1 Tax=Actinidia rufa TaxID=165716 RepID=A0A7J0FJ86_9ERIC|nr:hypothetical protein Acr_13g0001530 [Actinidia rufa]